MPCRKRQTADRVTADDIIRVGEPKETAAGLNVKYTVSRDGTVLRLTDFRAALDDEALQKISADVGKEISDRHYDLSPVKEGNSH